MIFGHVSPVVPEVTLKQMLHQNEQLNTADFNKHLHYASIVFFISVGTFQKVCVWGGASFISALQPHMYYSHMIDVHANTELRSHSLRS